MSMSSACRPTFHSVRFLFLTGTAVLSLLILLSAPKTRAAPALLSSNLSVGGAIQGLSGTTPESINADFFTFIDEPEFATNPNFGGANAWSPNAGISASQETSATVTSIGPLLDFDASLSIAGSSTIDFGLDPGSFVQVESIAVLTLIFQVDETSTFEISNSTYALTSTVPTSADLFQISDVSDLASPLYDLLPASSGSFDGTGILLPGTYQLEAHIGHAISNNGSASQDLNFSFTVVPEPSTALLLGLGLGGLVIQRRAIRGS